MPSFYDSYLIFVGRSGVKLERQKFIREDLFAAISKLGQFHLLHNTSVDSAV